MDQNDSTRERLKNRVVHSALVQDEKSPKYEQSGARLAWMFDFRGLLLDPDFLHDLTDLFWSRHGHQGSVQVGGMEYAGIPLVTALVMAGRARGIAVNGFVIRKERKPHGSQRLIEGEINEAPIIFVDDLLNTGSSLKKAEAALLPLGRKITSVFTIIDFKSPSSQEWRNSSSATSSSVFGLEEFGVSLKPRRSSPSRNYLLRWRFKAPGGNPFHMVPKSAPLVVRDRIYVGSDSGVLWCLNARTGSVEWKYETASRGGKGLWSSPRHHDGSIYFGAYNGAVIRLDAESGAERWINEACDWVGSTPALIPDSGRLIIGLEYARPTVSGSMAALDMETGAIIWQSWLREPQHGSAVHSPRHNLAIAGTNDHNIVACDVETGRVRWHHETERSIKYPPALDEGRDLVAAASMDRCLYLLEASTGRLRAKIGTDGLCYTTPLLHGGRLFCGSSDKRLHVVDLDTSAVVDRLEMGARIFSNPVVLGDSVCFGTCGGLVCEIDPDTLDRRGEFHVPDAVTNAIAQSDDGRMLFVPTYMNEVYAFERSPSASPLYG